MKKTLAMICAGAILTFGLAAVADDEPIRDVTEYRFEDEAVVGGLVGVERGGVVVRKPGKTRSLIRVRTHFVPEMLKEVEDI